ncbi:MAG: hypothetical protein M0027_17975 [Candidatus Dormibacteraeota bacterium]|nr:hypothetical protein [Candidatus Dormibacteraeota bacterium]
MKVTKQQQTALKRIADDLAQTGLALPGSLSEGYFRCGSTTCKCATDPARLHGPYAVWTLKADSKTVTRRLAEPELAEYRPLFENAKRLRTLIAELQELTLAVVGTPVSPGTPRQSPATTKVHRGRRPARSQ